MLSLLRWTKEFIEVAGLSCRVVMSSGRRKAHLNGRNKDLKILRRIIKGMNIDAEGKKRYGSWISAFRRANFSLKISRI